MAIAIFSFMLSKSEKAPGFTPLDEEREASMADEGGASGAAMEAEDANPEPLIAVPHTATPSNGLPPETSADPSKGSNKERSYEDTFESFKDSALLIGLVLATAFHLMARARHRKRAKLHVVERR